MTDPPTNRVLKSLKASVELHREIKMESAKTGEKIEDLVERAWQALKSIPKSGDRRVTEKRPTPIGETPDSPVLQVGDAKNTGNNTAWEHEALSEILESENATAQRAIRSNLHAFRQLVRSVPNDSQALEDAGSESLSEAAVDHLYQKGTDLSTLARGARRSVEKHPAPGKGHRTPKKGTA